MTDDEKIKSIVNSSQYDCFSVKYGAEEMAKYKNEQFKELIRKKAKFYIIVDWHDVSFDAEKFIKDYLNS